VNSLKVFNDFLQVKGIVDENYIQLRRDRVPIATGSEQVVNALTDEDVEKVLFYIQNPTRVSKRNHLIVHLLLYTAVRVSELVNIKPTDIDDLTFTLIVRGKGDRFEKLGFGMI